MQASASATSRLVAPGAVIGRVRIDKFLGEGAVGAVYRGHHTTLGIDVALKVLKADAERSNPEYRERFRREARIAAKLDHPGLVRVIDFGEDDGVLFLVMDYVDGAALERFLHGRQRPMAEANILKVILAVAQAMGSAHTAGIVHRDLKPANILVSRKGQLRVADLGLAREAGMPGLTRERMHVGSPAYMSPEALTTGSEVDHRTDIYALGIIGYQMTFNALPYSGDLEAIIRGHLLGDARFDRPTRCSRSTIKLLQRLMAKDAADRPQSMDEVAAQVRPLLEQARRREAKTVGDATSGSRSAASASASDNGFVRFFHSRLGAHVTETDGRQVVHTQGRERLLVWVMLAAVAVIAVTGYLMSR